VSREPRVRLGSWDCPSGNNVVVFYRPLRDGLATLEMEWDTPPPLFPADEVFYLGVIRPAVVRLMTEYTERSGRALVVDV
jgi:hypothetical protein